MRGRKTFTVALPAVAAGLAALLCSACALAQAGQPSARQTANDLAVRQSEFANLGQLLDAGGKLTRPPEFKQEVAQRLVVGALPSGSVIEVMYTSSGSVAGSLLSGFNMSSPGGIAPQNWPISGSWTIDDSDRICASMRINSAQGTSIIPNRCQFWFKFSGRYYVSDSDEDRSAKLLVRLMKQ